MFSSTTLGIGRAAMPKFFQRASAVRGFRKSLHERHNLVDAEASDPDMMEPADEEIEARAARLIRQVHEDKIRKHDEEIASLS